MESKTLRVKYSKAEDKINFYTSFGWVLSEEPEDLGDGKVLLQFERDKKRLAKSYRTVKKGEKVYHKIARPYPLAFIISFVIGSGLLVAYFALKQSFAFYIVFLYFSLTFYCISVYLLIIFLILFVKRHGLLKKVVHNVAMEAGTVRDLPMKNNIKEETDDTWIIASNL